MKRLIIGDIHGCYAELLSLIKEAALLPGDEIIAVGDLVDRGPAPAEVLRFFGWNGAGDGDRPTSDTDSIRSTAPHKTVTAADLGISARSVLGNHERKHIRSFAGEIEPALSQSITRRILGDQYPSAVTFMGSLPLYIELSAAWIIHGFFEPGVPIDAQPEKTITGVMGAEEALSERFGKNQWFLHYDGLRPLVFGHHHYSGDGMPLQETSLFGIPVFGVDTGCCKGHRLTGIVLPGFRIVSTPAARDYWAQAQKESEAFSSAESQRQALNHWKQVLSSTPPGLLTWEHAEEILSLDSDIPGIPELALAARRAEVALLIEQAQIWLVWLTDAIDSTAKAINATIAGHHPNFTVSSNEHYPLFAAQLQSLGLSRDPLADAFKSARVGQLQPARLRTLAPGPGDIPHRSREILDHLEQLYTQL